MIHRKKFSLTFDKLSIIFHLTDDGFPKTLCKFTLTVIIIVLRVLFYHFNILSVTEHLPESLTGIILLCVGGFF